MEADDRTTENARGASKLSVKQTFVVNLFAGAGAGKSTSAAGLFERLKWNEIEAELVTEFAKDIVWEGNVEALNDQLYLFGVQHHRIWRLMGKVEVIITDSPLILSSIYKPKHMTKFFDRLVLETHKSFPSMNFFIDRVKPYNPNGRVHTEEESRAIDLKIKQFLDDNKIVYKEIPGTKQSVDEIAKDITFIARSVRQEVANESIVGHIDQTTKNIGG